MRITSLVLAASLCCATLPVSAQTTQYEGMCDASAGVSLGGDYFVAGDDEQSVLHVYRIGHAQEVGRVDLARYLGVDRKHKEPREVDIEGAARIGDRIYWISSHGRDGDGKVAPSRHRLFATTVSTPRGEPPTIAPVDAPPYMHLLHKAMQEGRFAELAAAEAHRPEDDNGLSIEGLAATPDGQLLIGFRNPRPNRAALILPLRNPAAVVDQGRDPVFGNLFRLDLGGRGIRSLEWVDGDYRIIGGPHDDRRQNPDASSFALYRWAGPGHPAQSVDSRGLADLGPEALFKVDGHAGVYVLSDDGDVRIGKDKCKKAPAKLQRFRGLFVD
ncbi:DUF3616 domain-containing protein [Variovorax sp. KK3]|uniref:DUF3616 domain-containing protein n=1 Tax=Variovorax sp. KK3 TaxID=1855728 RepID=UPI00097C5385|nr:DUF3616 domain-containing protein [Variovorax sp. KK3]